MLWYLRFQMMEPLHRAEEFLERLSRGHTPPPLSTRELASCRMQTLFSGLNLLRDRLRSLNSRLENGIAREAELRREVEKYDRMQISLMARLLPETRRSIGVIKGLLLGGVRCADEEERSELASRALHRTAYLSREIEKLIDLSRLGLARWNEPRRELFDTAVFLRELAIRSTAHLKARNIFFESGFSGRTPERLRIDRELLYQLLSIMVRAVGRAEVAGGVVKLMCHGDGRSALFAVSGSGDGRFKGGFSSQLSEIADSGFCSDRFPAEVLALGVAQDIARRIGCVLAAGEKYGADLVMELPADHCVFGSDKLEFSSFDGHDAGAAAPFRSVSSASGSRPRQVLMFSEDADESLAVAAVLRDSGIKVECFPSFSALEAALPERRCDGVIISPRSFGIDPEELIFRLRRTTGRPNLAVAVLSPQMSDELFRRLADLDRVSVLIMPVNYEMLAATFSG